MPRAELYPLHLPWTKVLEAGGGMGARNSWGAGGREGEEHIH